MNIFAELHSLLSPILPAENDVCSENPPDTYAVLVSIDDRYAFYADDKPIMEISSVRISVFSKNNYLALTKQIKKLLIENDFCITACHKVAYKTDTKYHHYAIEVEKDCPF